MGYVHERSVGAVDDRGDGVVVGAVPDGDKRPAPAGLTPNTEGGAAENEGGPVVSRWYSEGAPQWKVDMLAAMTAEELSDHCTLVLARHMSPEDAEAAVNGVRLRQWLRTLDRPQRKEPE